MQTASDTTFKASRKRNLRQRLASSDSDDNNKDDPAKEDETPTESYVFLFGHIEVMLIIIDCIRYQNQIGRGQSATEAPTEAQWREYNRPGTGQKGHR